MLNFELESLDLRGLDLGVTPVSYFKTSTVTVVRSCYGSGRVETTP